VARNWLNRLAPFLGLVLVILVFAILIGEPEKYLSLKNLRTVLAQTSSSRSGHRHDDDHHQCGMICRSDQPSLDRRYYGPGHQCRMVDVPAVAIGILVAVALAW